MRTSPPPHQLFFRAALLMAVLAATCGPALAADEDEAARDELRREKAKAALEERMKARLAAGWTPKSKEEQLLTKLRVMQRQWEVKQERAQVRAEFEKARAEVYMDLARHYIKYGSSRRSFVSVSYRERGTGLYRPYSYSRDFWVLDPLAARLSDFYGSKAARSKGIAAAQEYCANTIYERRVQNTSSRIAALQNHINMTHLAAGAP